MVGLAAAGVVGSDVVGGLSVWSCLFKMCGLANSGLKNVNISFRLGRVWFGLF